MKQKILWVILSGVLLTACGNSHFLKDKAYREAVVNDLQAKQKILYDVPELFAVLEDDSVAMSLQEREAMMFLYAYMPLSDLIDYSADFYLKNIQSSFAVRKDMPWGKEIPEYIFRHFVLPVRVNNEYMDSSRMFFFEELKDRVKELSMEDAILEVNHWCHEKVVYQPSDSRTSAPLATVKTAYGRCGEESTFTVAALRAVGIPARQVYTPRWAHTDNNHAWVEAWANGKWHYLGACEPEPILDMGWFDAPVKRAMLLHTRAFGRYTGPEDVMSITDCFYEINVTSNYAPVDKGIVKITDQQGNVVEGADVEFKIYNYADYYTVLRTQSDSTGHASLNAGLGDLMVWATKDGKFGFSKITIGSTEETVIPLRFEKGAEISESLDIIPPVEVKVEDRVSQEQRDENTLRMQQEDALRNAYIASFISRENSDALAARIEQDPEKVWRFISESWGNWSEIKAFLENAKPEQREAAMAILGVISAKDLRDTPAAVLADHLDHLPNVELTDFNIRYIINPRVSSELLCSYRSVLPKQLSEAVLSVMKTYMPHLVAWARDEIIIYDHLNPQRIPILPTGVGTYRIADANSRNIYFVALCRSLGIPARIDGMTRKVQFFHNERWMNANLDDVHGSPVVPKGKLMMKYTPTPLLDNPVFGTHFTVSKVENGELRPVNLRSAEGVRGPGTWKNLFSNPLTIDEGYYVVFTGSRMASGKVLGHVGSFTIKAGETTTVELVMRQDEEDIQVIDNIDAEAKFDLADGSGKQSSILETTGRGYFVVGVLGTGQEPTNHALRDFAAHRQSFEKWDRQMILLFPNENQYQSFNRSEFPGLPANITFGIDSEGLVTKMIVDEMKISSANNLPIFVIADTFGRVVYVSAGYKIGLGEEMLKVISQL